MEYSVINKRRAKAHLKEIKAGKRADGFPFEPDLKVIGIDGDGKAFHIKDEYELNHYKTVALTTDKI